MVSNESDEETLNLILFGDVEVSVNKLVGVNDDDEPIFVQRYWCRSGESADGDSLQGKSTENRQIFCNWRSSREFQKGHHVFGIKYQSENDSSEKYQFIETDLNGNLRLSAAKCLPTNSTFKKNDERLFFYKHNVQGDKWYLEHVKTKKIISIESNHCNIILNSSSLQTAAEVSINRQSYQCSSQSTQ